MPNKFKAILIDNQNNQFTREVKEVTEDILKEYFVFTIVRNPWDRLYSQYKFRPWLNCDPFKDTVFNLEEKFEAAYNKSVRNIPEHIKPVLDTAYNRANWFDEFIHIPSQVEFLNGKYNDNMKKISYIDYIGRFEDLDNSWKYICNKLNFIKYLYRLQNYGEVLIEKFIPGREIQVAILDRKKLGAIELKPKRKFYDYEAKYNPNSKTEHIIPVKISKKQYNQVTDIALKAHKILKCRGVTRSDFRFYNNKFYLLETNTQPGMTSLSLVPEIANYNNITFIQLIEKIIKDASINK